MAIEVLLFGQLVEITKTGKLEFAEASDTEDLKSQLFQKFPKLAQIPFAMALNKKLIQENTNLNRGDHVALLPPFSGG